MEKPQRDEWMQKLGNEPGWTELATHYANTSPLSLNLSYKLHFWLVAVWNVIEWPAYHLFDPDLSPAMVVTEW